MNWEFRGLTSSFFCTEVVEGPFIAKELYKYSTYSEFLYQVK